MPAINVPMITLVTMISASDKRFNDLLTSMKDELLKEKLNSTNDNIKITEDVEKIKENYVKKDEEK